MPPVNQNPVSRIDLRNRLLPPRDQEQEPTCVGFAMAAMREYFLGESPGLSPRYLYHSCKQIDKTPNLPGTYLRIATQVLKEKGICEENIWPYQPRTDDPPSGSNTNALLYRTIKFIRLDEANRRITIDKMKEWLGNHGCFVAGVWVYESWGMRQAVRTGVIPDLTGSERIWDGHAICVVGYDDETGRFIFRNSWGAAWGEDGYGYLSYEYMASCCFEAWGIDPGAQTSGEAAGKN